MYICIYVNIFMIQSFQNFKKILVKQNNTAYLKEITLDKGVKNPYFKHSIKAKGWFQRIQSKYMINVHK